MNYQDRGEYTVRIEEMELLEKSKEPLIEDIKAMVCHKPHTFDTTKVKQILKQYDKIDLEIAKHTIRVLELKENLGL